MGLLPAERDRELCTPSALWDVSVSVSQGCGGELHGRLKMRAAFAVSAMLDGHPRRFVCDAPGPVKGWAPDVALWRDGLAVLAIDVLSAANRLRATGDGFRAYRMQEGLHHVLLIDSERPHVVHAERGVDGWRLRDLPGGCKVELAGLGVLNLGSLDRGTRES